MSDYCTVTLDLIASDYARAKEIIPEIEDFNEKYDFDFDGVKMQSLTFNQVNYGELEFEERLQEQKIPYDKGWSGGSEYGPGIDYFRVSANGETVLKSFANDEQNSVALTELIHYREQGIKALDDFIARKQDEVNVISWVEQKAILTSLSEESGGATGAKTL